MKYLFECILFIFFFVCIGILLKMNQHETFESPPLTMMQPSINPFLEIPEEMIVWKPHAIDIYHQPTYSAYFFDNHYMYPVY